MNQMDHQYYQERLSAFADNELPLEERAQVEAHLRDCPDCRKRLADLRRLEELVIEHGALSDSDYWEQAAQRIESALPESARVVDLSRERKHHSALWWRLPAIAASVVFLIYIGVHEKDILKQEAPEAPQPAPGLPSITPQKAIEPAPDKTSPDAVAKDKADAGRIETDQASRRQVGAPVVDTSRANEPRAKVSKPAVENLPPAPAPQKVAPAAEVEPAAVQDALEDNSLQFTRERSAAAAAADTDNESLEAEDIAVEGYLAAELQTATDKVAELTVLRVRRDSLVAALPELLKKDARSKVGLVKALNDGAAPMVELQAGLKEAERKDKEAKAKRAETLLIDTWFGICRISADSVEVDQGVAFLKSASKEGRQEDRDLAERYLKELGR